MTGQNHFIDIHSHILPHMDDGSGSYEMSLNMLRIAYDEGIHTIIATPHNMPGKGFAAIDKVKERIEELHGRSAEMGIDINILPGSELYYRGEIPELIENGTAVPMNGKRLVLVEFEPMNDSRYIINALKNIMNTGYTPIVAHVERYPSLLDRKLENIAAISDMGCYIQMNASTVTGKLGFGMRRLIHKLFKEELIDFIGTDAHSDRTRAPRMAACAEFLYKKCSRSYADSLLFGLAQDVLL